jgi:hypothetical protein
MINVNAVLNIVTNNGLLFEIEESGLLPCFALLGKIVDRSPVVCINNIDSITTACDKVFTKWIATVGKSDRAVNIVRAALRVFYKLNTCEELLENPTNSFTGFFNSKVNTNADGKNYYEDILKEH